LLNRHRRGESTNRGKRSRASSLSKESGQVRIVIAFEQVHCLSALGLDPQTRRRRFLELYNSQVQLKGEEYEEKS
jgi:hypothetical protein